MSVRLIGIDTPKSIAGNKTKRDAEKRGMSVDAVIAMGKRAKEAVEGFISAKGTVELEFDVSTRDRYGRLLAYVHKDGIMLNEWIVEAGYAYVMTIQPNVKYQKRFTDAYRKARKDGYGLWK